MFNRNSDSLIGNGGRNLHKNAFHHRRSMSYTNTTDVFNNNVDFYSHNRHSFSAASSESDLEVRLGRLSVGSTKPGKSVLDDLLSTNEGGKHDYDWLLTPPGTPLLPSSDGKESQPTSVSPRRNSSVRSGSSIKTSRLSVSQSESSHSSRPARSSSATSPSISTTQYTNYSNRNSNILNTSSASVSSYIKPSTPTNRSSASRPTSRTTTPSRTRQSSTTTSIDRTIKPSQNSRPSTPTIRPSSRPSSPISRVRPHHKNPSFSMIFRTKCHQISEQRCQKNPLSAGRSRPGAAMTVKGHVEDTNSGSITRRQSSSPIVNGGRIVELPGRGVEMLETRKTSHLPESLTRRPVKMSNSESGMGFGRSISKKSLDMAIKHMDIRNGGIRSLSGSTLFPQSIRTGNPRIQPGSRNGNYLENKGVPVQHNRTSYSGKVAEVDIYESSRYDSMLLKEDLKNTSWLHSTDENNDQSPVFDNGLEPLPEPFAPL